MNCSATRARAGKQSVPAGGADGEHEQHGVDRGLVDLDLEAVHEVVGLERVAVDARLPSSIDDEECQFVRVRWCVACAVCAARVDGPCRCGG